MLCAVLSVLFAGDVWCVWCTVRHVAAATVHWLMLALVYCKTLCGTVWHTHGTHVAHSWHSHGTLMARVGEGATGGHS